ncbi:MAG: ribbon-helix-helix protein, CopG family [Acidilobus sp.]|nr:ribbon-helix-helix protein, CopG family [Acidilobus sp.]
MPRPRKYPERGITLTAYVSREIYERIRELARSRGLSVSEVVQELLMKGLGGSVTTAADPPDPPEDALHVALKGLEPLERERVLQFMQGLEDAEAKLAKLRSNTPTKASTLRSILQNYIATQQEMAELKATVNGLKRTYEKVIKRTVRDPATLNMIGERLLRLMRELGVPA